MTERQEIVESLYEESVAYGTWKPPARDRTLVEVILWLQGLLNSVPADRRNTAMVDIERESGYTYDDSDLKISIWYTRLEADAEYAERRAKEEKKAERMRAEREASERAKEALERHELARLKHKFEGGPAPKPPFGEFSGVKVVFKQEGRE